MSSFSPATVFKDKISSMGRGASFRKGLTILQFVIAVALISSTITVYKQIDFMRDYDLGIELDQTLAVNWPTNFSENFDYFGTKDSFIDNLLNNTAISEIAYSSIIPGVENFDVSGGICPQKNPPEDGKQIYSAWVSKNFLDFFNIELICGRGFLDSDFTNLRNKPNEDRGFLINRTASAVFGFANPEDALGNIILYDTDVIGRVVGVIEDYHQQSLDKALTPTIFYSSNRGQYYIFKIDSHNIDETLSLIKDKFNMYYPGNAFVYSFIDEVFNSQYRTDIQFGNVFSLFAFLAILIASLGLFGLASFTTIQRTKEIGIRKILGASSSGVVIMLTKEFTKWVFIANIIAWPVAYYFMQKWLEDFTFRTELTIWIFLISGLLALIIACISVIYQAIRAAVANPIESLRYE